MAPATTNSVEFEIQGHYGYGWECVTTEETLMAARTQLTAYNAEEPEFRHRIKIVRTTNVA